MCPECQGETDCAVEIVEAGVSRVLCAGCGRYFDRSASPRVRGELGIHIDGGVQSTRAMEVREFDRPAFR